MAAADDEQPEWPMPDEIVKTPEPEDDLGAQVPDTPPVTGIDDTDTHGQQEFYEHVCTVMQRELLDSDRLYIKIQDLHELLARPDADIKLLTSLMAHHFETFHISEVDGFDVAKFTDSFVKPMLTRSNDSVTATEAKDTFMPSVTMENPQEWYGTLRSILGNTTPIKILPSAKECVLAGRLRTGKPMPLLPSRILEMSNLQFIRTSFHCYTRLQTMWAHCRLRARNRMHISSGLKLH